MSKFEKLLFKLLSGNADKSFSFSDLVKILETYDFAVRIKGSHHIFYKEGVSEIMNLQNGESGKAKPYQVKQVRELLIKYKIVEQNTEDDES
ncbi:MAG: type II toxin-antitoxin system HicA family toxin [Bacteroidota bacterium]